MYALFLKLLNMSAAGSVLILAVVLLRVLLKKAPRWILCVMWALVALRLVCPVSIASPLSAFRATPSLVSESGEVEVFRFAGGSEKPLLSVDTVQIETPQANAETITEIPGTSLVVTQRSRDTYLPPLVQGYLLGLSAMLLYAAVSTLLLRKKVKTSLKLEKNVRICDAIPTPFILGVFRPRIYLPSSLSEEERSFVLAHENAHLRRHDHWWKPLGFLILSIHWFNPLCWLAYELLCRDIELACDEKVIRELGRTERAAYSQTLLNCSAHRILAACPVAFGETDVKTRVKAVLNYKKPVFWVILAAVLGCIVLVVCFAAKPLPKEPDGPEKAIVNTSFDPDEYLPLYQDVLRKYYAVLEAASRGEATPSGREEGDAEDYDSLLGSWSESIPVQHFFDRDPLGRVGWTLEDLNGDRVPELLIGSVDKEDDYGSVLFALYTIDDGAPICIARSFERFRYYDLGGGLLLEEGFQPELPPQRNYWILWELDGGELRFKDGLIYDKEIAGGNGQWFGMYSASSWEFIYDRPISEEEALAWQEKYTGHYLHHTFTPFAATDWSPKPEQAVGAEENFMSLDGTVEYVFSGDSSFVLTDLPVVEVRPHEITAEEAKRLADALFPDAAYYDYVHDAPRTKADLQASMERWRSYLTDGTLNELFCGDEAALADMEMVLGRWEESFAEKLAAAPETETRMPAQWAFRPDSDAWAGGNPGTETIRAIVDCGGLEYSFCAANRTQGDFSVHMLYGALYNKSSPNNVDALLQQYELCRSPRPTEAQLRAIREKARAALAALDAGEWEIDLCLVERLPRGQDEAYLVTVKAVPVFQGSAAIRFAQLVNMRSDTEGAQHYYYSDANFSFAPDGTLLDFSIRSPVDVVEVRENGGTLSGNELMEAAKERLAERGLDVYSSYFLMDHALSAKVCIDRMTYGLVRIEVENGKTYRYVPALCLDGHLELYGEHGKLFLESETDGLTRMLVLNGLDGTEIVYNSDNNFARAS